MSPYKVLLFDFDGTLCQTQDSILYSFKKTFAHYNTQAPAEEDIMHAVSTGGSLPEILPSLRPGLSPEELSQWVQTYRHIYSTEGSEFTTLFTGTKEVLAASRAAGMSCVVLSNKGQKAIEESLLHFGISSYFDLVIGDNPAAPLKKKPHPMAFREAVAPRYPVAKSADFLMIGDTHADLAFANNANIDSCWAQYGYGDHALCQQQEPRHTVKDMAGLLSLVVAGSH